jgi:geranylgeranyl pyrophosphate synthase
MVTQLASRDVYGPAQQHLGLVEAELARVRDVELPALRMMLEHALAPGGKRIRPALTLLSGYFGEFRLEPLVYLGASIELLHTATLVHDDVIDAAQTRRGRATANSVFDNSLTVLLGDFMFANAAEMVTRTGDLAVVRQFALCLMKMASGELDQDAAAFDVGKDIQHYLSRISGKTAALFVTGTKGAGMLSHARDEYVEAFQIKDDILDFIGSEEELGKPVGSDLRDGTLTLPALLLLERYPRDNPIKKLFRSRGRRQEEYLQRSIDLIHESDVLDDSLTMARGYTERALDSLRALPAGEARTALEEVVTYVVSRRT